MREIKYCCDRCGKEIPYSHSIKDCCGKINFYNIGQLRTNPQAIDLCSECCEKFINFMEGDN